MFDVQQPCTLKTVKVYTDSPGTRIIELRNSSGIVLQSATVFIPIDSNRITLNFLLTPGSGYELTTNTAQNNLLLGYDAPRLQRSNSGVTYPYNFQGAVSLINSPAGTQYYYYFYDWEVEKTPKICISDRAAVLADVVLGVHPVFNSELLTVYPNPTTDKLFVVAEKDMPGATTIEISDISGRLVRKLQLSSIVKNENKTIDIAGIESGVYFIRLLNSNLNSLQRVVIE